MSFLFSSPSTPAVPTPPTIPTKQEETKERDKIMEHRRRLAMGRGSTILTGGSGIMTDPTTYKPTLLGG